MRRNAWIFIALAGCRLDEAADCATVTVRPGDSITCAMPGYVDRAFDVRIPSGWDGTSALPVIVALHGGGAFKGAADGVTCPHADSREPECLGSMATARGYAVVLPNGTGSRPLRGVRTWNAGGGMNGYVCGFGAACGLGVDDVKYIDDLFVQLEGAIPVDPARVFATGISNGGAMAHRLACEDRGRFAAIAPLSGANLYAAAGGACAVSVPVLHIHGTKDPAWDYAGGDTRAGFVPGVDETMEAWRIRNGCAATYVDDMLPDIDPDDGTTSVRRRWDGCAAATERIEIIDGGHTWPRGNQYLAVDQIGRVAKDFGNEIILDFFDAHPRP